MKLNLTLEHNSPRSGYVNINPLADPNNSDFIKANVNELGLYVDDGEAEEIIVLDLIDFVPPQEKENIMRHWLSKLAIGGTITIGGNDIGQISKSYTFNHINLNQFSDLVYGKEVGRSGLITCSTMRQILESAGLRITESKIDNFSYIVKAERVQ